MERIVDGYSKIYGDYNDITTNVLSDALSSGYITKIYIRYSGHNIERIFEGLRDKCALRSLIIDSIITNPNWIGNLLDYVKNTGSQLSTFSVCLGSKIQCNDIFKVIQNGHFRKLIIKQDSLHYSDISEILSYLGTNKTIKNLQLVNVPSLNKLLRHLPLNTKILKILCNNISSKKYKQLD